MDKETKAEILLLTTQVTFQISGFYPLGENTRSFK